MSPENFDYLMKIFYLSNFEDGCRRITRKSFHGILTNSLSPSGPAYDCVNPQIVRDLTQGEIPLSVLCLPG